MKLIHVETRDVVEFPDKNPPPYAILSHTWSSIEDATQASAPSSVNSRLHICLSEHDTVIRACEHTIRHGITYLWIDALCIDTSSSAELDEGINGSFRRLKKSTVCLAYLDDLPADGPPLDQDLWRRCRYWGRAWTLQELILPSSVEFFDQQWNHRGSKTSSELLPLLSNITGIPKGVLLDSNTLSEISLAARMSWAADRGATREEDTAYSMGAITGVTMPVRYGEGAERAFLRLQEEILHDTRDGSIFAWSSVGNQDIRGFLARSPAEFRHFATASASAQQEPWIFDGKVRFSSKGIQVQSRISKHGSCILLEIGRQDNIHGHGPGDRFGVYLREWNGIYVRVNPTSEVASISGNGRPRELHVARDVDPETSIKINAQFDTADRHVNTAIRQHILDDDSSILKPFGTKRSRSGCPMAYFQSSQDIGRHPLLDSSDTPGDQKSSSSESTLDDTCSSSSGEYEDAYKKDDKFLYEDGIVEEYDLDADHRFQTVRLDILKVFYEKIQTWIASAQYVVPSDNRLSPRKRARTSFWKSQPAHLEEKEDQKGLQPGVVSCLHGYLHLACPFYISNPTVYQKCLLQHDFQSIEDVIRHLRKHHTEPPYCPICRQTFDKVVERDGHIYARKCELRSPNDIGGLNEHQKSMLAKRDKLHLGVMERWLRIWTTVFPNAKPHRSPYLENGIERKVTMIRDLWTRTGRNFLTRYLVHHGLLRLHQVDEERAITALCRLTLDELLRKVFEEHRSL